MTREKKNAFEPRTQTVQDKSSKVQRQSPYSRSSSDPQNSNNNKGQEEKTVIFDSV